MAVIVRKNLLPEGFPFPIDLDAGSCNDGPTLIHDGSDNISEQARLSRLRGSLSQTNQTPTQTEYRQNETDSEPQGY
jgi:hypothetical protein